MIDKGIQKILLAWGLHLISTPLRNDVIWADHYFIPNLVISPDPQIVIKFDNPDNLAGAEAAGLANLEVRPQLWRPLRPPQPRLSDMRYLRRSWRIPRCARR